jgi:hypothetical protein
MELMEWLIAAAASVGGRNQNQAYLHSFNKRKVLSFVLLKREWR